MRESALRTLPGGAGLMLVALAHLVSCGSESDCKTTATCSSPAGSGGATTASGGSESGGGSGGSFARGGGGGELGVEGGAAGTGGGATCVCNAYEFCRAGQCVACSQVDVLAFNAPEKLGIAGRYPRPTDDGGLVWVEDAGLWFSGDSTLASAVPVTNATDVKDSAPLYLPGLEALLARTNFFFLRSDANGSALLGGRWLPSSPPALLDVVPAPSLFDSEDGLNYSLAVSVASARAWWRTTRSALPGIVTAPLLGSPEEIERIELEIAVGGARCPANEYDPTAWVTPDGAALLFRHTVLDASCAQPLGFSTDLFGVALDPLSGKPTGPALQLGVWRGGNARDSDPALSQDCSLYFSSDAGGNGYELYRARPR